VNVKVDRWYIETARKPGVGLGELRVSRRRRGALAAQTRRGFGTTEEYPMTAGPNASDPTQEDPTPARRSASWGGNGRKGSPRGLLSTDAREKKTDAVELSELLAIVRRRLGVVIASAFAFLSVTTVLALRERPVYRATAVLRLGATEREAVTQGFEAPAREADRYVNPLASQTQLLRSRSLLREVVDSVGYRLQPDYGTVEPRLLEWLWVAPDTESDTLWLDFDHTGVTVRTRSNEGWGEYGQPVRVEGVEVTVAAPPGVDQAVWRIISREAAVDRLMDRLRVSPRPETNIVDVSFVHPDPVRAQFVANTLVTQYQRFEAQFAQDRSSSRRAFLEEQVAQTDSNLAQARAALRSFQSRAQTYDARQELASQQQNRMLLDIQRGELDAERRMYRGLLDQLESTTDEGRWSVLRTLVSSPGIAENAAVARIHEQLMRQKGVLDSLTTGAFGSAGTNPDVLRQRQLIEASEAELTSAIRSHVASLDARAVALNELAERTAEELADLPYQLAEEARLQQIVDTYQKVSDQVREELQRARVAEAATGGQADIIDLAALPYEPEPGTRVIKLGLGLLLGVVFGFGAAFFLERSNRIVQTRSEIEERFNLPVLGVIPRATAPDLIELETLLAVNGSSPVENGDKSLPRAGNHAMEAFRLLRTNFLFAQWTGNVKSIVVTSTAPQEGKTFTSASLAASMAEEGARVLLMDADLWRGRIHEILDTSESPGLMDVLAGAIPLKKAIRPSGLPGVDFLTRGARHGDPSALASSKAMRDLLARLGQDYDVLVVDAPPVLAAGSAPVLPAVADGVLMLVRAGQTDREALQEALRALNTVGASLLGFVLNDPEDMSIGIEKRYYYRYEYVEAKA
jgi:tyrosine-protein kinase Etk/Wzc